MQKQLLTTIIKSRNAFDKIHAPEIMDSLGVYERVLYESIVDYYLTDAKADLVDVGILQQQIKQKNPKHYKELLNCLNELPKVQSEPNIIQLALDIRKDALSKILASRLLTVEKQGVEELIDKYQSLGNAHEEYIKPSVAYLQQELSEENRIKLYPQTLHDCTGGALRGHNILVFGRPEIGKSAFLINLAGCFLRDGKKVLFIENEDVTSVTLSRIAARILEVPADVILSDKDYYQWELDKNGFGNLVLCPLTPGTLWDIERLTKRHKPDIVCVNQLSNLHIGNAEGVQQREQAGKGIRAIAKRHNILAVSSAQAGGRGIGKLYLDLEDLDFSQTGLQGAVDLLIGIGMSGLGTYENDDSQRGISILKNKLSGKHARFMSRLDKTLNIYR
jgi:hypothetical protein